MKTQIQYVNKKIKPGNWIGMNVNASKKLHVPFKHKHPEHTIEIYRRMPKDVRVATEHHEEMESYLMNSKHYKYPKAHNVALRFENMDKPFPKKNIKENLDKMGFNIGNRTTSVRASGRARSYERRL